MQTAACLQNADAHFKDTARFAEQAFAKAAGADAVNRNAKVVAEFAAALIGHQDNAQAAAQQFTRQSFGGKDMATGSSGSQDD